jgi:hypothetical protein
MRHVTQLIVYGSLAALAAGGPVIETTFSPAEECRLSAPCSFGIQWSPHGHELDYGATPAIATEVVEASGGVASFGWLGRRRIPQFHQRRRDDAAAFHRYYLSQVQRKRKIATVMMAQAQVAGQPGLPD